MGSFPSWTSENAMGHSGQPLLNICIILAILETFFIIAFIISWYFNGKNTNNTKVIFLLMLAGYMFSLGGVVLGILKITMGGAGYHASALRPATIRIMFQLVKAHEAVYVVSIPFPKLAIICLYFRLFRSNLSRWILYTTALVIAVTCIFGLTSVFANCRPFYAFWDRHVPVECTMDVMAAFRYYSVPHIATDVVMLAMPIPALWKLQVSRLAKIGVTLTFLTSTFGIVTAVLRFIAFLNTDVFEDITYNCITTTGWTIIEPGVYLIAATMPTLRPLLLRIFKEANSSCIITRTATQCFRSDGHSPVLDDSAAHSPRVLQKKDSSHELINTIGGRPSRTLQLDDYHRMRSSSRVFSIQSEDEESMLCADAIVHEQMGRQGRNPDGTLRAWSLQPIQTSPLRASFFFDT